MSDIYIRYDRIETLNRFYYPDIMVTCEPKDQETSTYKRFSCLIVEVLFNSTEAFDRRDKFIDYQTLNTLQEYVLINTKQQRLDCFRRTNENLWVYQSYSIAQETFELKSVNFTGSLKSLYENVVLEQKS